MALLTDHIENKLAAIAATRAAVSDQHRSHRGPRATALRMLDLRGSLGRRFGGIGAGVFDPSLVIEVERAECVEAEGQTRIARRTSRGAISRRREYARRARIAIRRAIPEHAGLGSGTQLALSVARGIAELYDLPRDVGAARDGGRTRPAFRDRHVAVRGWRLHRRGRAARQASESLRSSHGCPFPIHGAASSRFRARRPRSEWRFRAAGLPHAPAPPLRDVEHVAHLLAHVAPSGPRRGRPGRIRRAQSRRFSRSMAHGSPRRRVALRIRSQHRADRTGCASGALPAWGRAHGAPRSTASWKATMPPPDSAFACRARAQRSGDGVRQ